MKLISSCIILLLCYLPNSSNGQHFAQWGNLVKGEFSVGYKDTVLFKANEKFEYHDYKGQKPFFVSIWYPATDNSLDSFMRYRDYLNLPKFKVYEKLRDTLIKAYTKTLINDAILKEIKSGKRLDFNEKHKLLFEEISDTKVMAKRSLKEISNKFPCVFYHHGAQSTPFDNNVFCEYMASHGFVVVSSSYQLPGTRNSLIESTDKSFTPLSDIDFILNFTRKLTNADTNKIIAAGHSWGGQMELMHDNIHSRDPYKLIISFHTTLENKEENQVKEHWPEFNYLLENECSNSTTPTFLFAPVIIKEINNGSGSLATKHDTLFPKFLAFRNNKTTPYSFITVKSNVTHNGFISIGNLSSPYALKYDLEDKDKRITQQKYYEEVIVLTKQIITLTLNDVPFRTEGSFNSNFKIENLY